MSFNEIKTVVHCLPMIMAVFFILDISLSFPLKFKVYYNCIITILSILVACAYAVVSDDVADWMVSAIWFILTLNWGLTSYNLFKKVRIITKMQSEFVSVMKSEFAIDQLFKEGKYEFSKIPECDS
jgi:hypothetical protein